MQYVVNRMVLDLVPAYKITLEILTRAVVLNVLLIAIVLLIKHAFDRNVKIHVQVFVVKILFVKLLIMPLCALVKVDTLVIHSYIVILWSKHVSYTLNI